MHTTKAGKETTEKQRDLDNEMRDLLMHTPDIIVADEAHELRTTRYYVHILWIDFQSDNLLCSCPPCRLTF